MAGSDAPHRDAAEPLSRLLARSDAVERELQRARDRLEAMAERYAAEEPLDADRADGSAPATPDPADEPPVDVPPDDRAPEDRPVSDLAQHWVIRVPDAAPRDDARDHDARDDDAEADDASDPSRAKEPSIDITVLQEAARRRLSDER
ncbi:MAG TPA: hypothetical protein VLA82_06330 [Actinomycetota bacterium]|nr:hypothetical protein [Actinomycetota bacterium]